MRLLEVNGVSLLGASHTEAVNVLRRGGNGPLHLVVCNGYDRNNVERIAAQVINLFKELIYQPIKLQ